MSRPAAMTIVRRSGRVFHSMLGSQLWLKNEKSELMASELGVVQLLSLSRALMVKKVYVSQFRLPKMSMPCCWRTF